ncbi:SAM-dependent methyltransferase [Pseudomonas aeruginosa]|uniref:class I SAM-dependent methyltransferase n=1 Tax=Pseudomonas aeruginosa TaxID=287 RepID=UPI000F542C5D|nr:class I SAM-dependent methyltransferase [Pseudomonas aeruginosa]RQC90209.1 SAM-dependent methyltransferase [Pseudomonas aeruginosa]
METRRLFDQGSAAYASARPRYPDALYRHLAGLCGQRRHAWDCATGTGQAALGLAQYFGEVLASDTSTQQIEHAIVHPGIRYSVQDAEATDYPDAAFDLVCVAQAWHWFDHSRFNRELLRVLRPGGVFAAWGYGWFSIDAQIDAAIDEEYLRPIGPYWAQQNRLLWNAYRDVELPLGELPAPAFVIEQQWSLARLFDYMATWSASRLCREAQGNAFVRQALQRVAALWGEPTSTRRVRMPLALRIARKDA